MEGEEFNSGRVCRASEHLGIECSGALPNTPYSSPTSLLSSLELLYYCVRKYLTLHGTRDLHHHGRRKTETLGYTGAGDEGHRHRSRSTTPQHGSSCDTCTLILQAFATPASESRNSPLGAEENLLASSCSHTRLIRWASASTKWSDHGDGVIHVNRDKDSIHGDLRHYIEREHYSGTCCSPDFGLIHVALPE